jgi:hypothetical protein
LAQAPRRLVDDDEIGIPHQRAAHRQHLLLAAGEHTGRIVLALAQIGEQRKGVVHREGGHGFCHQQAAANVGVGVQLHVRKI